MPLEERRILDDALDHPVTAGMALASVVVFIQGLRAENFNEFIGFFAASGWHIWIKHEYWRPFSAAIGHGNILHLSFNLLFLWHFGPIIESWAGAVRTMLIVLGLALVSSCAELACSGLSSVGLSGVLFGLFGLAWAGRDVNPHMALATHPRILQNVVFWFFLCIILTLADVLPIANWAHGAGFLAGFALGRASMTRSHNVLWGLGAFALSVMCVGGSWARIVVYRAF